MRFPFSEKVIKILRNEEKRATLAKDLMDYKIAQMKASQYLTKEIETAVSQHV